MDVSAVVLHKLLSERNLDIFSKLKLAFLDPAYSTLYSFISKHYDKYGSVPSFQDIETSLRDGHTAKTLATLKLLEVPDVSAELALDALIDQYTQSETIKRLERFVDKLPLYDTEEIKQQLSTIALEIEEKTYTSESVVGMDDIMVFQHDDEINSERVFLGLNNSFDAFMNGAALQEYILIGGKRGSGKSIVSSNIFVNQYTLGNSSIYFSIEMKAREVYCRNMAILSGVPMQNIMKNELSEPEILSLVKVRAGMFTDGHQALDDFMEHRDRYKFEETLVRNFALKPDNQMIIVDDQNLTIGSLDLHISKAKSKFGDKFKVAVVDYLNQIVIEGNQYDWQPQVELSKKLKNLARKYDIVMISPYQIDATGEARFAKGILDAPDVSLILDAHTKEDRAISFDTTKMRSHSEISFTSGIDWSTLRISPQDVERPEKEPKEPTKKPATKKPKSDENISDLPWDA